MERKERGGERRRRRGECTNRSKSSAGPRRTQALSLPTGPSERELNSSYTVSREAEAEVTPQEARRAGAPPQSIRMWTSHYSLEPKPPLNPVMGFK